MSRSHALPVKPVAQTVPERQRIEPDPPVEPDVCPSPGSLVQRRPGRHQRAALGHTHPGGALGPGRAAVLQDQLEPVAEAHPKLLDDAGVEEKPRREGVGKDEPDGTHKPVRAPRAMRSASDAPSSPWKRSASAGVPQAGQPSTPSTVSARPASDLRSESPSPPTGA